MSKELTEDFYKEGYAMCINSAKALFNVANQSAQINEFGIARSLNVLAAEEAIKGICVLTNALTPTIRYEGWDDLFKYHKVKHENIMMFTFVMDFYSRQVEQLVGSSEIYFERMKSLPKEIQDGLMATIKPILDELEWSRKQKQQGLVLKDALAWWKSEANIEKNNGFYVNEKNNEWHNPRNYTKEQYESEKKYTQTLIENAERFEQNINSPQIREILKTEKIEQ